MPPSGFVGWTFASWNWPQLFLISQVANCDNIQCLRIWSDQARYCSTQSPILFTRISQFKLEQVPTPSIDFQWEKSQWNFFSKKKPKSDFSLQRKKLNKKFFPIPSIPWKLKSLHIGNKIWKRKKLMQGLFSFRTDLPLKHTQIMNVLLVTERVRVKFPKLRNHYLTITLTSFPTAHKSFFIFTLLKDAHFNSPW